MDDKINIQIESVEYEPNKELLRQYIDESKANGLSEATQLMKCHYMKLTSNYCKKPFTDISKEEIIEFFNEQSKYLQGGTMHTLKANIKSFFKWLNQPEKTDWIKTKQEHKDLSPEDILKWEDIIVLAKDCYSHRSKTMLILLFDSGMRVGELCGVRVGDLTITENETMAIKINKSKTFTRTIYVDRAKVFLQKYLSEEHPNPENKKAPLFYKEQAIRKRFEKQEIIEKDVNNFLNYLEVKSGYKKHLYPHLFRHSRATEWFRLGGNEVEARHFFGWSRTSNQPSFYSHLANSDIENSVKRQTSANKEVIKKSAKTISCPSCGYDNFIFESTCHKCYRPLDEKKLAELEQLKTKMETLEKTVNYFQSEAVICSQCESPNLSDASYCRICGTSLGKNSRGIESYQNKIESQSQEIAELRAEVKNLVKHLKTTVTGA